MRAIWYTRQGAAEDVLVLGELEPPVPGISEVRVRVTRSGINPHDTKNRSGWTRQPMPAPRVIPHSDGAGIIEAVGPGVSAARIGERVWVFRADSGRKGGGTAADLAVVPSCHAIRLPDITSFDIGACLGVPAITAHAAVFLDGPVTGQTLLIQGGAGAVSQYAIQLARWNGARVITTVSSDDKADLAVRLGADAVVNYRKEDVVSRVRAFAGADGVDRIVEVDFGANLAIDHEIIRENGKIASYSSTKDPDPKLPYYAFARKGVTLHFVQGKNLPEGARAAAARDITVLMERDLLRHPELRLFPLEETVAAHQLLESSAFAGKVLVSVSEA